MKRAPITAATVALMMTCATAVAGPPGPPFAPPQIDQVAEKLGLDETQKSEVSRIMQDARARVDAAAKQSMDEADAELANVLTTEQLSEFKKLMQAARPRWPPPPDPSPSTNQ
jgi:Spy/CpxP family protein refolding chaperone